MKSIFVDCTNDLAPVFRRVLLPDDPPIAINSEPFQAADLPRLLAGCPNPQAHPRIGAWREAFRALGVSGKQFPSSVEALARRALKGGQPLRINPLVDLSAAVSLTHLVPTGGFDMAGTPAPLEVRLTRLGERFQALDEDTPTQVEPGEVAYAVGSVLLTRHLC